MDVDVPPSPSTHTIKLAKKVKLCMECRVCGDHNARIHYGALSCRSCEMFFRRNVRFNFKGRKCVFGGECEITVVNRQVCRYCRLERCLSIGMQEELIRSSHPKPRVKNVKNKQLKQNTTSTDMSDEQALAILSTHIHLPNLIQKDRSLLTVDQWCLLSNVVNSFDEKAPTTMVRNIIVNHGAFPLKMRIKMTVSTLLEIVGLVYQAMSPYYEAIPHFNNLSLNDRTVLLERNFQNANPFANTVTFRDTGAYSSDMFKLGFPSVFGPTITNQAIKTVEKTDNDGTLLKLIAPVLMLSTNTAIIVPLNVNDTNDNVDKQKNRSLSNTMHLLHIQNIYVEMMFKYMIYRFGYDEAALRFATLMTTFLILSMNHYKARQEVKSHDKMMDNIVNETERLLTIQHEAQINSSA